MESTEETVKNLRGLLNQRVVSKTHYEVKDKDLGNYSPISEPFIRDEDYQIIFLGIYGWAGQPLYVLGRNVKNDNLILFRNASNFWVEEETGNPNHDDEMKITAIGDVDVRHYFSWFATSSTAESCLCKKIASIVKNEAYWAELLIEGKLSIGKNVWNPQIALMGDLEFIQKAMAYLDKIV